MLKNKVPAELKVEELESIIAPLSTLGYAFYYPIDYSSFNYYGYDSSYYYVNGSWYTASTSNAISGTSSSDYIYGSAYTDNINAGIGK